MTDDEAPGTVRWIAPDGTPIDCREKLRVLAENRDEIASVLRDAFEDAVLMGVDPGMARRDMHALVDALRSPKRHVPGPTGPDVSGSARRDTPGFPGLDTQGPTGSDDPGSPRLDIPGSPRLDTHGSPRLDTPGSLGAGSPRLETPGSPRLDTHDSLGVDALHAPERP